MKVMQVGQAVEFLGVHRTVPTHTVGTIVEVGPTTNLGRGDFAVEYRLPGGGTFRKQHAKSYESRTWKFVGGVNPATMIVQSKGEMDLYQAASTEVITGVVPQVKYGSTIVWQGDPVPVEDGGASLTVEEQHTNALNAAKAKIEEVVKKQFQE